MRNKRTFIKVAIIALAIVAAVSGGLFAFNALNRSIGPLETTRAFFKEWTEYQGNPINDRIFQNHPLLAASFEKEVADAIAGFDRGGYDPILLAQDIPSEIKLEISRQAERTAVVDLLQKFGEQWRTLRVDLAKRDDVWQIIDIRDPSLTPPLARTSADQKKVSDHIRDHIAGLSPEDPVLGGSFYVTETKFLEGNEVLVSYEDGHISLTAKATYELLPDGTVRIDSFSLVDGEADAAPDFRDTGNLTRNNGNWTLVYEEPGKPALTVTLVFDGDSRCVDQSAEQSCVPAYWEVGDRAEVVGHRVGETVEVSTLRIVGEASGSVSGPGSESGDGLCVDRCGNGTCEEVVCLGEGCPCAETPTSCPEDCG